MACFLVSVAESVVVKAVEKAEEKKEERLLASTEASEDVTKVPFSRKLRWLTYLLWGGGVLLMFEHIWHGEIVAWFPFLTAMSDPADTSEMISEMMTVGVSMAALITLIWGGMCLAADSILRRAHKDGEENI